MRKIITSGLALLLLVGMAGCSQEPEKDTSKKKVSKTESSQLQIVKPEADTPKQDVPSDEAIADDLRSSLATENQYAEITGIEMVKSLSEEGKYSATFTVQAATKYADWTYEADMKYTKYDQGWMVDDVDWKNGQYERVRLPEVDEMVEYAGDYLLSHEVYSDVWFTEYLVPMESATASFGYNTTVDDDVLEFSWNGTEHLKHADVPHVFNSLWYYEPTIDNWTLYPDNEHGSLGYHIDETGGSVVPNYSLNFSGNWRDKYRIRYTEIPIEITLSNFSWEEFDANIKWKSYDYHKDQITEDRTAFGHFIPLSADAFIPEHMESYVRNSDIIFCDGEDKYITFSFSDNRTKIWYIANGCEIYIAVDVECDLPNL